MEWIEIISVGMAGGIIGGIVSGLVLGVFVGRQPQEPGIDDRMRRYRTATRRTAQS